MMFILQFVVRIIVQLHVFLLVVFTSLSRMYDQMRTLQQSRIVLGPVRTGGLRTQSSNIPKMASIQMNM